MKMNWINKLLSLFNFASETDEPIQNGGFIDVRPKATDRIAGDGKSVRLIYNESADWSEYLPEGEIQNNPFVFDSQSCVSFSRLNTLEAQMNYLIAKKLMPETHIKFLNDNGYMVNGKVNFSDIFTAIMSGTTINGNDLVSVVDSARNHGLVPQSALPFGDYDSWGACLDKKRVTASLKALGLKFKTYFEVQYEWTFVNNDSRFDEDEYTACQEALTEAPIQIAIPNPAHHAVMLSSVTPKKTYNIFDSYNPFVKTKKFTQGIAYAMKATIIPKYVENGFYYFNTLLKRGMIGDPVKQLQLRLIELGYATFAKADGVFGPATEKAVMFLQRVKNVTADGIVGKVTNGFLNDHSKRPLVEALIMIESQGHDDAVGDKDLTDHAYGCLQIRKPCMDDVNKRFGTNFKAQDCLNSRTLSVSVFEKYMKIYGNEDNPEISARVWNGGPTGWKKQSTLEYWKKVKKLLV